MAELNVGQQCDGERKKKKKNLGRFSVSLLQGGAAPLLLPLHPTVTYQPRTPEQMKNRGRKKKKNLDDN